MKTSIEISMYPLTQDYEPAILDFIQRLNTHPELEVSTNGMSTQVFGIYDVIFPILQTEMKRAFESEIPMSIVLKILNVDTSAYGS